MTQEPSRQIQDSNKSKYLGATAGGQWFNVSDAGLRTAGASGTPTRKGGGAN